MTRLFLASALITTLIAAPCHAQSSADDVTEAVRKQLQAYLEVFNQHDAEAAAEFWTAEAVSVQQETGERTEGRGAILADLTQVFGDYPDVQLAGTVDHVRAIGSDVAVAEGRITLVTAEDQPAESAFTVVLQKVGENWLIASAHQRNLPTPVTTFEVLQGLEWLVGTWQDQTEGATVTSTVRWTPNQAFLIRSFEATFDDGEGFSGTQIFGWDPRSQQILTWTFNSDGSFGDGTVSKNGDEWMIKMNQVQSDGGLASGTTVITPIDENTFEVQKIGESIEGEPIPMSDPVTVVRVVDTPEVSAEKTPAEEGGEK